MKAKFGAIVVDGRGKLGGHVVSKNRSGTFFRTKVTPTNPNTSYQSAVRATLSAYSKNWSALLTEGERAGWNNLADTHLFNNIFGESKKITGINFYVKTNGALENAGETPLTVAPDFMNPAAIATGTLTMTAGGAGTGTIAFTTSDASAGHIIMIYATNNLSPGVSFVKSQLRFIGSFVSATSPANFAAAWRTKYGAGGFVTGKKIFLALEDLVVATGALGIPFLTSGIVP